MNPSRPAPVTDSERAARAIGAMFFSVFGGMWLALWAYSEFSTPAGAMLVVAVISASLLGAAYRAYKTHSPARRGHAETPEILRRSRTFNLINAGQWLVIFLVASTLSRIGYGRWILPAIILIIGLHFLPLAKLFAYRPHAITGGALVLLACVFPFLAPEGPERAVGALGAGLVLWLSAVWALSPFSRAGD